MPPTVAELFDGYPFAREVYDTVAATVAEFGEVRERVTKTQVAFRRRKTFALLWTPGRWLSKPQAEVVLSIARPERIPSDRFKEVVRPARGTWMHHLEVTDLAQLDPEVRGWLHLAWADAA